MAKGIKTGGREQGTPNKLTQNTRELINEFISNNIGDIQSNYDKLEPKERMYFFTKLLEYSIPRLKTIEQTIIKDNYNPIQVIVSDKEAKDNLEEFLSNN